MVRGPQVVDDLAVLGQGGAHLVLDLAVEEGDGEQHRPSASRHPPHLAQRGTVVRHVLEDVRMHHQVEGLVREGQPAQVLVPDRHSPDVMDRPRLRCFEVLASRDVGDALGHPDVEEGDPLAQVHLLRTQGRLAAAPVLDCLEQEAQAVPEVTAAAEEALAQVDVVSEHRSRGDGEGRVGAAEGAEARRHRAGMADLLLERAPLGACGLDIGLVGLTPGEPPEAGDVTERRLARGTAGQARAEAVTGGGAPQGAPHGIHPAPPAGPPRGAAHSRPSFSRRAR